MVQKYRGMEEREPCREQHTVDDDNQVCRSRMLSQKEKRKVRYPNPTPCREEKVLATNHWTATFCPSTGLTKRNERPQSQGGSLSWNGSTSFIIQLLLFLCRVLFSFPFQESLSAPWPFFLYKEDSNPPTPSLPFSFSFFLALLPSFLENDLTITHNIPR